MVNRVHLLVCTVDIWWGRVALLNMSTNRIIIIKSISLSYLLMKDDRTALWLETDRSRYHILTVKACYVYMTTIQLLSASGHNVMHLSF